VSRGRRSPVALPGVEVMYESNNSFPRNLCNRCQSGTKTWIPASDADFAPAMTVVFFPSSKRDIKYTRYDAFNNNASHLVSRCLHSGECFTMELLELYDLKVIFISILIGNNSETIWKFYFY